MKLFQLLCLSLLTATILTATVHAQQLDRASTFKTFPVFHMNHFIGAQPLPAAAGTPSLAPLPAFGGSPYTVGPTVTVTTTKPEAEEEIALDPLDDAMSVAAISDFSLRGGFNTTKYALSVNNGATWKQAFIPRNSSGLPATSDGGKWQANSDPVVAIDKLGNYYLADLYIAVNSSFQATNDGFYVTRGNLSTGTTTAAANTKPVRTSLTPSSVFEDKPWIAVDNSSNATTTGNVYVCWTHFTAVSDMLFFSRSTDHGSTWSKAIQVSPAAQNGGVQGCQVAAGTKGEVYVSWEVFFTNGQVQIWIAKSTNGGTTFPTRVAATAMFHPLSFRAVYRDNSFPAMAVNPHTGFVYIVYADQPGTNSAIEFIRDTTAGGTVFTNPLHINDKTAGQRVFPAVSVDAAGVIGVSWFDTRNSPTNANQYDVFATRSLNNGGTFAPNARVTASTINLGNSTSAFIGDYSGIAGGMEAHPVWTSGGFGNGSISPLGVMKTAKLD
jgi:hypothetical protein